LQRRRGERVSDTRVIANPRIRDGIESSPGST
jgi:hypothetical protein